jgi:ABC-type cobalt transport system substrate-binding protein
MANKIFLIVGNKRLIAILMVVAVLLAIPLVAMQFTDNVKWSPSDFIAAGILLLGTGLACEFVLQKVKKIPQRIAIIVAILAALVLIWLELAVGIFGTPLAGS